VGIASPEEAPRRTRPGSSSIVKAGVVAFEPLTGLKTE